MAFLGVAFSASVTDTAPIPRPILVSDQTAPTGIQSSDRTPAIPVNASVSGVTVAINPQIIIGTRLNANGNMTNQNVLM